MSVEGLSNHISQEFCNQVTEGNDSSLHKLFCYSLFFFNFPIFFPSKDCTFIIRYPVPSLLLPWEQKQNREKGQAFTKLYNELAHGSHCAGTKWLHPACNSFPLGKKEEHKAGHAVQRPSVPGVSTPDAAAAVGTIPAVTTLKLKAKCRVGEEDLLVL